MKTIELKELEICNSCPFHALKVESGEYFYEDGMKYCASTPYVSCKYYPICEKATIELRKGIIRQIGPEEESA